MNTLLVNLLASIPLLTGTQAAPPNQPQVVSEVYPSIAGKWRLSMPDFKTNCYEEYNFKSNQKLLIKSGEEWTLGQYQIVYPTGDELPILILKTSIENNMPDCSNTQEDQSGKSYASYMRELSPKQLQLCSGPDPEDCNVSLYRVMP